MVVDYNKFAKTFSESRKNMKWQEIEYFLSSLSTEKKYSFLDIWCWNWRLLKFLIEKWFNTENYLWIDLSSWLLDEAKKFFPKNNFLELNMLDLEKINKKFDYIFLIASFHHLENIEDRKKVLNNLNNLLKILEKFLWQIGL